MKAWRESEAAVVWRFFHQWGSPKPFYELSGRFLPWVGTLSVLVLTAGLGWGLLFAPADYQQGHSVRIMYIHVPAAIVAQSSYVLMALCALVSLIWRMKLADVAFTTLAPIGAVITALALVTGAIWGKPTWGTYWVWDARLTSTLILFLLFTGVVSLRKMGPDTVQGGKAAALLAVVGVINLPIIKYSVDWWFTLHQPASFSLTERPAMPVEMWAPLLVALVGTYCWMSWLWLLRMRVEVLKRESRSAWAREALTE